MLYQASGGPRKEVEGKKKGKHKSSNPKKKYREPSKAVVPTRRRQGDPTLLLVEEAEEEEEIAVSDEDSTEDDRGLQEDEVSMATGGVSPGDIPATERVHTKDREGEESVDREEESVDREGEESVDREGEESVDREEESVDREGEESVDREGEESVDREGEESVDREGEESVDKEGEESVDREGEESVDRQEKSAVSVGEPDVGESPRDVLHAAHSVSGWGAGPWHWLPLSFASRLLLKGALGRTWRKRRRTGRRERGRTRYPTPQHRVCRQHTHSSVFPPLRTSYQFSTPSRAARLRRTCCSLPSQSVLPTRHWPTTSKGEVVELSLQGLPLLVVPPTGTR